MTHPPQGSSLPPQQPGVDDAFAPPTPPAQAGQDPHPGDGYAAPTAWNGAPETPQYPGHPGADVPPGGPGLPGAPGGFAYAPPPAPVRRTNALALTGLIVGGVGLLLSVIPIINNFAFALALVGLVLAIIGLVRWRKVGSGKGLGIAGIIVSVVAGAAVLVSQAVYSAALDELAEELDGAAVVSDETAAAGDSAAQEPSAEEPAAEEPVESLTAGFGETVAYEDGLEILVGAPTDFTPGEWSAGAEGFDSSVRFDVTITNGTAEAFDPSGVFLTASSGGREGSQVFDSENGLEGGPMTSILPGQSVTFPVAFAVADPADLVVQVAPGPWDYEDALFSNVE